MIRATTLLGLLLAAGLAALAEEFPLTFRTIPPQDVLDFPGGYGGLAQLRLFKPTKLRKEPRPVSSHPLYGQISAEPRGQPLVIRLDESKGGGKGYDQIIADMNRDGDLTDDTPATIIPLAKDRKASSQAFRRKLFGPIPAPPGTLILGQKPMFFALAYVENLSPFLRSGANPQSIYAGYVRLKSGWYADTTVELKGVKQRVGLFDGNANLRLGDFPRTETYNSDAEHKSWYFTGGDSFLVDANGSGAFERDVFETEWCSFAPVLYFGPTPCKVSLTPDGKSLKAEPWTEPLAEVALQPHGEQVCAVTLAWEQPKDQWRLIRVGVADGRIKVPPGNYRFYRCDLLGKGPPQDQVRIAGYQRLLREPVAFVPGGGNTLRCGAPLEIKVTAEKRTPQPYELARLDADSRPGVDYSQYVLSINANTSGAGGEAYSDFGKGEEFKADPPQPTFAVTDAGGRKVGSGKLEFG